MICCRYSIVVRCIGAIGRHSRCCLWSESRIFSTSLASVFCVAVLGPRWHLTYGESALILLGGGVGAIFGALCWGALSDLWGRKALIVSGTFICAFGAAAIALIPDGAWAFLRSCGFLSGLASAARLRRRRR